MKRTLTLAALLFAPLPALAQAAPAAQAQLQRWEYAWFAEDSGGASLVLPTGTFEGKGIAVLSQKVGGKTLSSTPEFLNYLGDQGWELVSVRENPRGITFYLFKRPKR